MSRQVYTTVKARCHEILRQLYSCVATPIEGASKLDFGDIDIVVAWPLYARCDIKHTFNTIKDAIGATRLIHEKGKSTSANFAIQWPSDLQNDEPTTKEAGSPGDCAELEKFIQVDIKICNSLQQLQWMLFKHSHGDIWNLLGTVIRPYGLTVDDDAMWLRIPEIETKNKKQAKVFLSSEPADVLNFLGLPIEDYWEKPFDDVEEMYEYIAQCHMFHAGHQTDSASTEFPLQLKSNDRKRMKHRPFFRQWIDDFIPRCRSEQRYLHQRTTRDKITKEAMERFNIKNEYRTRRIQWMVEEQKVYIWNNVIKTSVPVPNSSDLAGMEHRNNLLRALKKIILEGDESFGIELSRDLKDDNGFFVTKNVIEFINKEMKNIGRHSRRTIS